VPGMNSGLSPGDPVLIAAFRSALLHQGVIVLVMIVRAGFGVLWIFDGLLQAQPKMAGGLATQVIGPAAASSPAWVQHLVNWGGTIWSYHPVEAAAASVWIQVGIGAWLIAAGGGAWSRLPGAASAAWGLIVWVFGESFGGIFAPGLSWLTGAGRRPERDRGQPVGAPARGAAGRHDRGSPDGGRRGRRAVDGTDSVAAGPGGLGAGAAAGRADPVRLLGVIMWTT